jgi:hypothetical protein
MKVTIKKLEIEHEGIRSEIDFEDRAMSLYGDNIGGEIEFGFADLPNIVKVFRKATDYAKNGNEILDNAE